MNKYQVVVEGNGCPIYAGDDETEALAIFAEYMVYSMSGEGPQANKLVAYLVDGNVEEVHDPNDDGDDDKPILVWAPGHGPNAPDAECENCGMIDEPLDKDGFCEGCTCVCCGSHGSMDEWGTCSSALFSYPRCTNLREKRKKESS